MKQKNRLFSQPLSAALGHAGRKKRIRLHFALEREAGVRDIRQTGKLANCALYRVICLSVGYDEDFSAQKSYTVFKYIYIYIRVYIGYKGLPYTAHTVYISILI